MKKKLIACMLCLAMAFSMTACGGDSKDTKDAGGDAKEADESGSDVDYIKDKGTLVIGITEFEPMDYKDDSGEWVGLTRIWRSLLRMSLALRLNLS